MVQLLTAVCAIGLMSLCASVWGETEPSEPDEIHQFDFWLGDWDLAWGNGSGTNSITRIFGGSVIKEDFLDAKTGFAGGSMSMWRPTEKQWRQVWMDNQGGYLEFVGGWDGEQMVLTLDNPEDTGKPDKVTRMRWHDIEADAFVWTYESSGDDGATWTTAWEIDYTRRR